MSLLLLGFVLQIGTFVLIRGNATVNILEADEREYWDIASHLLRGGLAAFPVSRTLGFPLTLAAIRSVVGDEYVRVQFVLSSLLIFTGTPGLLALETSPVERACGPAGGHRCALLASLPASGATLFSDNLTLVLFILYLNLFFSAWQTPGRAVLPWGRWLLAGMTLGLASIFGRCT